MHCRLWLYAHMIVTSTTQTCDTTRSYNTTWSSPPPHRPATQHAVTTLHDRHYHHADMRHNTQLQHYMIVTTTTQTCDASYNTDSSWNTDSSRQHWRSSGRVSALVTSTVEGCVDLHLLLFYFTNFSASSKNKIGSFRKKIANTKLIKMTKKIV